jgi:DNA-directed RNA polymerase specialized sigma24 family protein
MARIDEAEAASVLQYLDGLARRRWPTLAHLHRDLVADAMADLVAWADPLDDAPAPFDLRRVATTILKRRVADHFRDRVAIHAATAHVENLPADAVVPSQRLFAGEVLRATLAFLASLTKQERESLTEPPDRSTPSERKQRQRLRERLREHLRDRLGADVDPLWKE